MRHPSWPEPPTARLSAGRPLHVTVAHLRDTSRETEKVQVSAISKEKPTLPVGSALQIWAAPARVEKNQAGNTSVQLTRELRGPCLPAHLSCTHAKAGRAAGWGKRPPTAHLNHHYLQRVQVGRVFMHHVRPPEVGTGHPQLALSPSPLGYDFAILIQKIHF